MPVERAMPGAVVPVPAQQVDLILQQIGSLPTLSPIAVRVMKEAGRGDADLREIASLISSDPALAAKVLALCRRADLGLGKRITTIDRAVVMLGLEAVRAALLSVEIHEMFVRALERYEGDRRRRASDPPAERSFDRRELWRHCIAVGCAAELIVESSPEAAGGFTSQEAFLAGLLHDLGKIALDALLPRSYERVAEIARERGLNIAEVERRVIGIDHHAAGKRLAEHWALPHALLDVMWLHGQPASLLPDVPHRGLIVVVSAADAEVRRLHLGWSGSCAPVESAEQVAGVLGIDGRCLTAVARGLPERVAQRCRDLGLDDATPTSLLLDCLVRSNGLLGAVTSRLDKQARLAQELDMALARVARFLSGGVSAINPVEAMDAVLHDAQEVLGGPVVLVTQGREGEAWSLHRLEANEVSHSRLDPPEGACLLSELSDSARHGARAASSLDWLANRVRGERGMENPRVLMLSGEGGGFAAVLLHSSESGGERLAGRGMEALGRAWGVVLSSAWRHAGAKRLGEQLAEANRMLAESQSRLVEQQSMVRLGEIAAGAAHELNNPLTVISGQAQALASGVRDPEVVASAAAIVHAAERMTELITSLHLFASPPKPVRKAADVAEILQKAARIGRQRYLGRARPPGVTSPRESAPISIQCDPGLPAAFVDRKQIILALSELILNGLQSKPRRGVEVKARVDSFDGRLVIEVIDDGVGMSAKALEHAFDPFFSELPAGRRTGLGLTRARRFVDLHGGHLTLSSKPGKGTTARIALPEWRFTPSTGVLNEAA